MTRWRHILNAMSDSSRVGVVIVNFNSGSYLERCLQSLFTSDEKLSIVVVDNLSSDQSLRRVSDIDPGHHSLKIIKNEDNLGFSRAVNIGVADVDCELVMVLNPDCQVHGHSLRKLSIVFSENSEAGIVGALVFNEDGTEQRGCRRNEPTIWRSIITVLKLNRWFQGIDLTNTPLVPGVTVVDAVSGAAMMLRTDYLNEIGGMDESYFLHCEDLDVCRRMRDAGYQVLFESRVSLFHRQGVSGGTSFSRIEQLKHRGMVNYYNNHGSGSAIGKVTAKILVWIHYRAKLLRHWIKQLRDRKPDSKQAADNVTLLDLSKEYVLLSGANTDVGDFLLDHLDDEDREYIAVGRSAPGSVTRRNYRWLASSYFDQAPMDDLPVFSSWMHLAPIWTGTAFCAVLGRQPPDRVVVLSSTSIEIKSDSENAGELKVVQKLEQGEAWFSDFARKTGSTVTILRPTLIYGGPRNQNINLVRWLIRWFRFFPLVGDGAGKRQPVHARDVASACVLALDKSPTNSQYNIAGNEVLTYRQMVERVFINAGQTPRFVHFPLSMVSVLFRILCRIPGSGLFTPEMGQRLSRDQVFSIDPAKQDLAWQPGNFEP